MRISMLTLPTRRTLATALAALLLSAGAAASPPSATIGRPLPEFTHHADADWLNSKPLSVAGLRGNVVLVEFWAFECWNCYRSFPWLNSVEQRFDDQGLTVVSVHTPELPQEHRREQLVAKIDQYQLKNPVMIDNDSSYWRALGNQYWPAFYLIDRHGTVRATFIGETHAGDAHAQQIEAAIETLLAEPA